MGNSTSLYEEEEKFIIHDKDNDNEDEEEQELPAWENLWDWCLKKHYERNRHHPEHFAVNPEEEMTSEDKFELTCDLLGSVMGHALKNDINHLGLGDCRALIESQGWRHWQKWALIDNVDGFFPLPPASITVPILPPRWRIFPEEERLVLKQCYERLRSKNNNKNIRKEIKRELLGEDGKTPQLPCIAYYMRDLYFHKLGVERVWRMIPPPRWFDSNKNMESRIQSHDQDKYRIEMIIGYTQKWCF